MRESSTGPTQSAQRGEAPPVRSGGAPPPHVLVADQDPVAAGALAEHGVLGEEVHARLEIALGIAFLVERDRYWQHFFADSFVRRGGAHLGDRYSKTTRRGIGSGDGIGFDEVARLQAVVDAGGKRFAQLRKGFRRKFFGEQFD